MSTLPPATSFRPRALKALNGTLPPLWANRLLPPPDLLEHSITAMATRRTGLSDFGDDLFFRKQLRILLASLAEEARLNPLGRMLAHGQLLKVMKERLWAQALFTRHPEILDIPLAPPIVIVGPMRSGTTRLHRLLAQDTRFTALTLYESMCPVPWPSSERRARDPRIAFTAKGLQFVNWVNPANAAVHPTGVHEVDEELGLLEASASGSQIEAQRRVPSFARYGEVTDQTPAYAHMKRLLQLRTWFRGIDPARPYVLKTPQHMQDLRALLNVFPDAKLVFTHRDPVKVVGSSASLAWNQMVVQSDDVCPYWVGQEWLHKTRLRIDVTAAVRETLPAAQVTDIHYESMERDWQGSLRTLYGWLGRELPPATLFAMQAWLVRAEREHPHRSHRYDLSDYGLCPHDIRDRFADYRESFDLAA
ncbi:sulfotransferase family protein [Sandaracinobacteroides saxicola]|uniref:Sulfotransferase n=1 Tax=Sandaracinobacteroides saxicola TaxID=2759707 RepID=A0A7G5IF84_9SPHN|nr:sulfotransferase [Sandaracinobacteroides saxicola]QMW22026.1 sulfotransferase [Sandaracinobacteroides saxicola]